MIENPSSNQRCDSLAQELMDILAQVSLEFYKTLDYYHGPVHAKRVAAAAKIIQERTSVQDRADHFLVSAGSLLHQYHEPNLYKLQQVLDACGVLSEQQRADLYSIVFYCRPSNIINLSNSSASRPVGAGHSISSEALAAAKVVFDADAFDLVGPSGLIREARCNMEVRGQPLAEAITTAYYTINDLFALSLQTEVARTIAKPFSETLERWFETWRTMPYRLFRESRANQEFLTKICAWEEMLRAQGAPSYYSQIDTQALDILFQEGAQK